MGDLRPPGSTMCDFGKLIFPRTYMTSSPSCRKSPLRIAQAWCLSAISNRLLIAFGTSSTPNFHSLYKNHAVNHDLTRWIPLPGRALDQPYATSQPSSLAPYAAWAVGDLRWRARSDVTPGSFIVAPEGA